MYVRPNHWSRWMNQRKWKKKKKETDGNLTWLEGKKIFNVEKTKESHCSNLQRMEELKEKHYKNNESEYTIERWKYLCKEVNIRKVWMPRRVIGKLYRFYCADQ